MFAQSCSTQMIDDDEPTEQDMQEIHQNSCGGSHGALDGLIKESYNHNFDAEHGEYDEENERLSFCSIEEMTIEYKNTFGSNRKSQYCHTKDVEHQQMRGSAAKDSRRIETEEEQSVVGASRKLPLYFFDSIPAMNIKSLSASRAAPTQKLTSPILVIETPIAPCLLTFSKQPKSKQLNDGLTGLLKINGKRKHFYLDAEIFGSNPNVNSSHGSSTSNNYNYNNHSLCSDCQYHDHVHCQQNNDEVENECNNDRIINFETSIEDLEMAELHSSSPTKKGKASNSKKVVVHSNNDQATTAAAVDSKNCCSCNQYCFDQEQLLQVQEDNYDDDMTACDQQLTRKLFQ